MFSGEYSHSIDTKGRVIVPAKFRESLGELFTISVGVDGCLTMYSKEEWDKFAEKLNNIPAGFKETRKLQRTLMANTQTDCEVDKQGRVLIPANLRQYAGLEKEVIFAGVYSKVEIWSKERWDENNSLDSENLSDMMEHLASMDISF